MTIHNSQNMNFIKRTVTILILSLCGLAPVAAQKFVWDVDFGLRFDNREYSGMQYVESNTIFGARLMPQIGLEWNNDSLLAPRHRLMIGVDLSAEFGDDRLDVGPVFYYNYDSRQLDIYAGAFPRESMKGNYSRAFFSDEVLWRDRTLEGFLIRYNGLRNDRNFVEVGIDWDSQKSGKRREKFMMFSAGNLRMPLHTGEWQFDIDLGYETTVYHHAASEEVTGVMDNILAYPYLGAELRSAPHDTRIYLRAGWLQAAQRDRKHGDGFKYPGGLQIELGARWRSLGINNTLYSGGDIMPFYDLADESGTFYGSGLYSGELFYHTSDGLYNRLEAYWEKQLGPAVSFRLSTVHHYDGDKWGWQQMLTLSVKFDNATYFGKSRKTDR